MSNNTQNTVIKSELFGRVKWFNHRLGYGFITTIFPSSHVVVNDDVDSSQDIFVHHNAIRSEEESYKYLVQGEYVQFNLVDTINSTYKVQADEVRGIYSGKLMCDVHNEQKKHTNTIRPNSFKKEENDSYNRPRERERFRDRDRSGDRTQERERDGEREPQEHYPHTRYSYNQPRSQFNLSLPEKRIHPEFKNDEFKTPRSFLRRQYN